ncbi:glycosyltransferase [Flavobacterium sp. U410]
MSNTQKKKLKIALVGYTMADGGLEKMLSETSHLLTQSQFEVHVIVLENKISYDYSGKLHNLGIYSKIVKYIKLKSLLKKQQFDYIIDFRYRLNPLMELFFLNGIYTKTKVIYTVHSAKLEHYFTSNNWVAQQIFKKVFKVVTVSKSIQQNIEEKYLFKKAQVIYNFVNEETVFPLGNEKKDFLCENYIVAVGRLVPLKQFDRLLRSYAASVLPSNNIDLVIVGDGSERNNLKELAVNLKIQDKVHFLGFKNNPFPYVKKAQFLVLCSQYEGFGLVLVEALQLGVPVISFDCESGPSEIIKSEYNGLLVKDQDFTELIYKMNIFVEDKKLYNYCKKNAVSSVTPFHKNTVLKDWLNVLQ